jgi:hypothetical protein|tara:strand:+ start:5129 stop:5719 length:591 start_codon:yes stop_codon:yes gene_type:complete
MPEQAFDHALAGALIAELIHHELISLGVNEIDIAPGVNPPEEEELLEALSNLCGMVRPSLQNLITHLAANADRFRRQILDRLVYHKILRKDDEDILWVFHSQHYETLDLSEELAVLKRLRRIILDASSKPTREESVLIALVDVCELGNLMFSHAELEQTKARISDITQHDSIGEAVRETVSELQKFALQAQSYDGF